jgi:hypothetical protein
MHLIREAGGAAGLENKGAIGLDLRLITERWR